MENHRDAAEAMARQAAEIDFFAMEKARSCSAEGRKAASSEGTSRSSFSNIDPLVWQRVISPQAAAAQRPLILPPADRFVDPSLWPIPSVDPSCRPTMMWTASRSETAPMKIFYNGKVFVFHVSQQKAEAIMKMATESSHVQCSNSEGPLPKLVHKILPFTRNISLRRFLEKRKQRLMKKSH